MIFREALLTDIPQLYTIRNQVNENQLSDPGRITVDDYRNFLSDRGKGWVAEEAGSIRGFAIVDLQHHNVWALFVHPAHEAKGIGKRLQDLLLSWYFSRSEKPLWLSTGINTRAEQFYIRTGWKRIGNCGKGEVKFEMTLEKWKTPGAHEGLP